MPSGTTTDNTSRLRVIATGGIIGAILIAYINSLDAPFVFDDIDSIVRSSSIQSLSDWKKILFHGAGTAGGRPVLNLSFAFNYAISGLSVWSWHFVNLMIHVCSALIVFDLVRRIVLLRHCVSGSSSQSRSSSETESVTIGFFSSLIWAIHPIQTESVTYIVQRAESLGCLFLLLTVYAAVRSLAKDESRRWKILALTACFLGVATKETVVTAPVAVVVLDWWLTGTRLTSLLRQRGIFYLGLFLSWIPLTLLITVMDGRGQSVGFDRGIGIAEYLGTQLVAFWRYLLLVIWPSNLVLDYGTPVVRDPVRIVGSAISLLCLAIAAFRVRNRYPILWITGLISLIVLSPSSSFVPIVTQTMAAHRMYPVMVPLSALFVVVCYHGMILHPNPVVLRCLNLKHRTLLFGALMCMLLAGFGMLTRLRNQEYLDPINLWELNVVRCPEAIRAYVPLAVNAVENGRFDAAGDVCDRAVRADALAAAQNRRARSADLQLASVFVVRGIVFGKQGKTPEALMWVNKALKLNPYDADAYRHKGLLLVAAGNPDGALENLTTAANLRNGDPTILAERGRVYARLKRFREAIEDLSPVLDADRELAEIFHLRAICYTELGMRTDALEDFNHAIDLRPREVMPMVHRGMLHMQMKNYSSAIRDLNAVIAISPDHSAAAGLLEDCYRITGQRVAEEERSSSGSETETPQTAD